MVSMMNETKLRSIRIIKITISVACSIVLIRIPVPVAYHSVDAFSTGAKANNAMHVRPRTRTTTTPIPACIMTIPTPASFDLHIDIATTQSDILALADLRYDEFMIAESCSNPTNTPKYRLPSRYAFRMATLEIFEERRSSTVFIARPQRRQLGVPVLTEEEEETEDEDVVIGSAELSSIEFENNVVTLHTTKKANSIRINQSDTDDDGTTNNANTNCCNNRHYNFLYVTDVVTSSKYRRRGIANALMHTLEHFAIQQQQQQQQHDNNNNNNTIVSVVLFLHVKQENMAAYNFYTNPQRGYRRPDPDLFQEYCTINREMLEHNAGITRQTEPEQQQILLYKQLDVPIISAKKEKKNGDNGILLSSSSSSSSIVQSTNKIPPTRTGGGFGNNTDFTSVSSASSSSDFSNSNRKKTILNQTTKKKKKKKKKKQQRR